MKHRLLAILLAALCNQAFSENLQPVAFDVARLDYHLRPSALEIQQETENPALTLAIRDLLFAADPISPPPAAIAKKSSPAKPVEPIAKVTQPAAPAYQDIWARIRVGFKMPDLDTATTRKWEDYYASRPEYLNRIVERGSRYLFHVVDEVEKRDIPMEIALLPVIESAYNPKAESPAHAAGMWQFIPSTGKDYGLERTWWYDGRRDVVAATSAALDYLTTIHGMFDDWQLALASYNWGENAVARAVAKNQAAGLPSDYENLRMPNETANYVPKLMAVRNIIADPEAYGVTLPSIPNKPYFAAIDNTRHMDVKIAAQLAETSVDELLKLNPGFIRPVIAQKEDRKLVLPVNKVEVFQRNLAHFDQPLLTWQPYVTRRGESLATLAKKFKISLAELKDVNDISSRDRSARGQTILVPDTSKQDYNDRTTLRALAANKVAETVDRGEKDQPRATHIKRIHLVARGETLYSIAKKYNLTVAQLSALNNIKGNHIQVGDSLKISSTKRAT